MAGQSTNIPRTYELKVVNPASPLLLDAIALGDQNKRTLGLLPRQAYSEYAAKEGIVAALGPSSELAGYILFRRSRNWTHIAHLCISDSFRKQGIARLLVDYALKDSSLRQLFGVRLKCRRDYEANSVWSQLGFTPRAETVGRGMIESELTVWVIEHNETGLFSQPSTAEPDLLLAVVDANVFFDLEAGHRAPEGIPDQSRESQHLRAPWVSDAVELCVVDEMLHEINRGRDSVRRAHGRTHTTHYRELQHDREQVTTMYESIQRILGWHRPSVQQESDMWQVSKAAATKATLFLTRDEALLSKAAEIFAQLQLRVLRPMELLLSIDERENEARYAPAMLHGTEISRQHCSAATLDSTCRKFLAPQGERLGDFKANVREVLAHVVQDRQSELVTVSNSREEPIVLMAKVRKSSDIISIPILRAVQSRLVPTVVRHLLFSVIQESASALDSRVEITDGYLSVSIAEALKELRFKMTPTGWMREALCKIVSPSEAQQLIAQRPAIDLGTSGPVASFAFLEDQLWPIKVRNSGIPCWIIPIHAEWARRLFDSRLSECQLFRPEPLKLLNWENVYYRSARPSGPLPPARLLWYVTLDKRDQRTGKIRACSRLVARECGPAKDLFKKNDRLGGYEWGDLKRKLKGGAEQETEVLRFVDTELLPSPVSLSHLRALGGAKMLQGPLRIEEDLFFKIYEAARQPSA